ncbi:phosphate ABC transporter substrate-binding protein [Bacillus cereus]|uniref:PstS family phosphate ABC transporter substrate-binding protein n=1 Tax=Bacillus nitratireducens TaxID=2026193 RepID=UPI000BECB34E|nr:PstS family phosphate ABC transporter substrate-binding protein [Bacillus nitratireducens]PEE17977.1 phosphate ABC transporter substrate-binding protein [Bacillus cereus]MED0905404.1 PstS family phosphate ABC transporter substrate-binding protein [Bacillus nitratireducens]PES81212.1 phosphate ABC transporter substrate-binding protein [Bacillus cereus]PET04516.1 phosphate ABC transporter substrate-binding protein [Bacillus cereus]PFF30769.1 phosphate ABC transporter substrate-binding protein
MKWMSVSIKVLTLSACILCYNMSTAFATNEMGEVRVDGSSTVFPIIEAVAEEYTKAHPNVKISISISGTGGGFTRFSKGEVDINNASRVMKRVEENAMKKNSIQFTPFEVAYDGLTIVVNRQNTWVNNITIDELRLLWGEDGSSKRWSQIHSSWPREQIKFYAPGVDSGTYDYFQNVVLQNSRLVKTVSLSEDDQVIMQGVMNDKNAIAFVGYAYYMANRDKVKAIKVNGVFPTKETIQSGAYKPLARPLFTYVNDASIRNKMNVANYVEFMIKHVGNLAEEVGYVKLPKEKYNEQLRMLTEIKR